jgi:inositol oxygenase
VVGCKFSDKIIFPDTFAGNPDSHDALYNTECGIYPPHCGLDNVILSWGHDEVCLSPVYGVEYFSDFQDNASTFTACLKIRVLYLWKRWP